MKTVLIIDDEKPTLSMFRLFLKAMGYDVLTALNGAEGVELFASERPDIVMTDIKMPGMDGFDVLNAVKKIDPGAPVIMITGHGDVELARRAMDQHATDFVHKPIEREAVVAALEKAENLLSVGGTSGC